MSRASSREIRVGLVVVVGLVGLFGLLAMAGGGPGFLASRTDIDVVFRDAQGIRAGSGVRIAGLDAGRVSSVDLIEAEGVLRARLRLSVPSDLASKLRQDAKVTIQASLTGQSCVNIVSSGQSAVSLVPGQVLQGVETSMFDPILEQVGLGPVERNHLSHTISEVRQTVDAAGPRVRQILASLQETADGIRQTADAVRPSVESTAKKIDEAVPKVEISLQKVDALVAQAGGVLAENRENVHGTLANLKDLTATAQDIAQKDRPKIDALLDGLNGTRARADRVLYQADQLTGQGVQMLSQNRPNIDRTFANVRDTTDWADRLVQKLYGNPFYLSPLYKPTQDDVRAQEVYDSTQTFLSGAKELHDALKTLDTMRAKPPVSSAEQQALNQMFQRLLGLENQLGQTSQRLAEGLHPAEGPRARPRPR
jgi:phospholipid/cholesterol/gamma-HCH transport system substrate-binding protein